MTPPDLRTWSSGVVAALVVLVVGLYEASYAGLTWRLEPALVLVTLTMVGAVLVHRTAPPAALALTWLTGFLVVLEPDRGIPSVALGAGVVAYGCARYGSRATLWASGLSIPAAALLGALLALLVTPGALVPSALTTVAARAVDLASVRAVGPGVVLVGLVLAGGTLLVGPWLAGLALRARAGQVEAEAERDTAQDQARVASEVAALRAEQARLARDVHDVVGHSLAVILAQAESAQFRPDDDVDGIRETLEHVATAARQSLRDVRQVLGGTDAPAPPPGGLDALVDGVAATGRQVRQDVVGTPRPLPPELEVVAFRVLQEMLTNALKHGVRDDVVVVERHWGEELRLEVVNATDRALPAADGRGIDGMRRRLEAVGGRLDVRLRPSGTDGRAVHTATAWVPTRSREVAASDGLP